MTNQEKIIKLSRRYAQEAIEYFELKERIEKTEKKVGIEESIDLSNITNEELHDYLILLEKLDGLNEKRLEKNNHNIDFENLNDLLGVLKGIVGDVCSCNKCKE